jgi:ATP diphosphatase
MAEEAGEFDFDGVVEAICHKMRRRHPHVFGDDEIRSAAQQSHAWEAHKARERGAASLLDGIALALPALVRAEKVQRRAARAGFDWPDATGPLEKCREELAELERALEGGEPRAVADELGDLLFSCVNLARHQGIDAEQSLRRASARFEGRVRAIEARLECEERKPADLSPEALDALWEEVKADETDL